MCLPLTAPLLVVKTGFGRPATRLASAREQMGGSLEEGGGRSAGPGGGPGGEVSLREVRMVTGCCHYSAQLKMEREEV